VIRDLKNLEHGSLDPGHGLETLLSRDRPGIEAIPADGGFIKSGIIKDGEKANSKFQIPNFNNTIPLPFGLFHPSALCTLHFTFCTDAAPVIHCPRLYLNAGNIG
jgi:hypothetical protein